MATQLKHTDFTYTPTRPIIRVAFIAGEATAAVAKADLPDATLEDLAAAGPAKSLRDMLVERNALNVRINEGPDVTEAEIDDLVAAMCRIEDAILATPAVTPMDSVLKLITVAQLGAAGKLVEDYEAGQAILEARRHFGIGYVDPQVREQITVEDAPTASLQLWLDRWEAYDRARHKRLEYFSRTYTPVEGQHALIRSIWPANHRIGDDPAATAALALTGFKEVEATHDAHVDVESAALTALFLCPAPTQTELATKLMLFSREELHMDGNVDLLVAALVADTRRFGGIGGEMIGDAAIREAFADRRRTFEGTGRGATTTAEDEAYFARLDACDDTLLKTQATTLEGVIAKMRVAFLNGVGQAWSDLATGDPAQPAFVEGLRTSDMFTRLAWSAIEDLARIGGVSLSEQGR